MGLDTSHGCYSGAYSGFAQFRTALADMIDMKLEEMDGFGGKTKFKSPKEEPLNYVLDHSDCDGDIKHKNIQMLMTRMQFLLDNFDELSKKIRPFRDRGADVDYVKRKLTTFIAGLKSAFEAGEDVEFH